MRLIGYTVFRNGAGLTTCDTIEQARVVLLQHLQGSVLDCTPRAHWTLPGSGHIETYEHDGKEPRYTRVEELLVDIYRSPRVSEWITPVSAVRGGFVCPKVKGFEWAWTWQSKEAV